MGNAAVAGIMNEHILAVAIDDLQGQRLPIQRDSLRAASEQHLLTGLEPELLFQSDRLVGERREDVVVVDDAVLEDFDECRALMGMGGLHHVDEVLVYVDSAGNEPSATAEREGTGTGWPVDGTERSRRAACADAAHCELAPVVFVAKQLADELSFVDRLDPVKLTIQRGQELVEVSLSLE